MTEFTQITDDAIHMVDVSAKDEIYREATGSGKIILRRDTIKATSDRTAIKGNGLATARVAATLAIKDTARIILLCHGIPVHGIDIEFEQTEETITPHVRVISTGKTGVEMEALTGVIFV
ncbi:MAG: cyclic pyranopterin monophosphate synthase MoaC [Methanobacteriota archaeon]